LVPHECENGGTDEGAGEATVSDELSFAFHDEEVTDGVGDNLRHSHHQSVDEDVEFELVQHECRSVELENDGAL
jgi:hypothetical protein